MNQIESSSIKCGMMWCWIFDRFCVVMFCIVLWFKVPGSRVGSDLHRVANIHRCGITGSHRACCRSRGKIGQELAMIIWNQLHPATTCWLISNKKHVESIGIYWNHMESIFHEDLHWFLMIPCGLPWITYERKPQSPDAEVVLRKGPFRRSSPMGAKLWGASHGAHCWRVWCIAAFGVPWQWDAMGVHRCAIFCLFSPSRFSKQATKFMHVHAIFGRHFSLWFGMVWDVQGRLFLSDLGTIFGWKRSPNFRLLLSPFTMPSFGSVVSRSEAQVVQARVCEPCLRHKAINGGGASGHPDPKGIFPAASMAVGAP